MCRFHILQLHPLRGDGGDDGNRMCNSHHVHDDARGGARHLHGDVHRAHAHGGAHAHVHHIRHHGGDGGDDAPSLRLLFRR